MSMEKKLRQIAEVAAGEAALNERARCLWCADEVIRELKVKLRGKLLSVAEQHAAETKAKIAEAVVRELRRAIISGVRPSGGQVVGDVADFSNGG